MKAVSLTVKRLEKKHFLPSFLPSWVDISLWEVFEGDTKLASSLAVSVVIRRVPFSLESEWPMRMCLWRNVWACTSVCALEDELRSPQRNNGIRGQIEHEEGPTVFIAVGYYSLCAYVCVLYVVFCLSLCVFERMSVIALYLQECPILSYEREHVSLISLLTWCNKVGFCLSKEGETLVIQVQIDTVQLKCNAVMQHIKSHRRPACI